MINFSLNEMKILKILLKGEDYEPTEEDLAYIDSLGEKRAKKLLQSTESKLHKILNIRENVKKK